MTTARRVEMAVMVTERVRSERLEKEKRERVRTRQGIGITSSTTTKPTGVED